MAPGFVGNRRRRAAAVFGCDHRAGVRPGAGLVLGRHRLDFRHGYRHPLTVAAIATLAVAAKAAAKRFAATRAGYGTLALRGVEVGAALPVVVFGVLLLTGYVASERMGMF